MLKRSVFIATMIIHMVSLGQTKPLILKGRLENCPEKELYIHFHNSPIQTTIDTIQVSETGDFYFKTVNCEGPQKVSIQHNNTQLNDLMVAPGYELNISADVKDPATVHQTLTISGTGACVNNYRKGLEDLAYSGKDVGILSWIDSSALMNAINARWQVRDSLLNEVFNNCTDPYASDFKKMESYQTIFSSYHHILSHANSHNYDDSTYFDFINKHIPDTILRDPGKDEWLSSSNYRYWVLGSYRDYLVQLANRKDVTILKKDKDYVLKRMSKIFSGEVREYILYTSYSNAIESSQNLEELEQARATYDTIVSNNIIPAKKTILEKGYAKKYTFFLATGKGMPAPGFSLPDTSGLKHSLSDHLGKVIYIDFWASWCGPCRAENPSLKELYYRYRGNKKFMIIGVAVHDGRDNWLKAITQDRPDWLQLRDENGKANEDYDTYYIPRFAIIDKKGKIVTIDAPRPSEGKTLFKIIDSELLK